MDAQFTDSPPDRLHIPDMTESEAVKARRDQDARPFIPEPDPPLPECFRLLYLDHSKITVVYKQLFVDTSIDERVRKAEVPSALQFRTGSRMLVLDVKWHVVNCEGVARCL